MNISCTYVPLYRIKHTWTNVEVESNNGKYDNNENDDDDDDDDDDVDDDADDDNDDEDDDDDGDDVYLIKEIHDNVFVVVDINI